MGYNLSGFEAEDQPEFHGDSFPPLPEGRYLCIIDASEEKAVRDKPDQSYLKLRFQVVDGPHKGRQLFSNLNLKNHNPTAVRIAEAELGAIMKAVGVPRAHDSSELHDLPLMCHVKVEPRNDGKGHRNKIVGYYSRSAATQEESSTRAPEGSTDEKAPWKKRR